MKSLDITTRVGCKNYCIYCPQDAFTKEYRKTKDPKLMDLENFKRYLSSVPESVQIRFSGFAEPFLNPRCSEMIVHAYEKGHELRLYSTLAGMTQKDVDIIKDIKFDKFTIHLPDDANLTRIPTDENYFHLLKLINESNISGLVFANVGNTGIPARIMEALEGNPVFNLKLVDKAGNVQLTPQLEDLVRTVPLKGKLAFCEKMYRNNLLPNGDVILCYADWSLKHVIGNLGVERYEDIFKGKAFSNLLKDLALEDSSTLCRTCTHARPY